MSTAPWSELEHARAVKMWAEGSTIGQIARDLGRTKAAVGNRIARCRSQFARRPLDIGWRRQRLSWRTPSLLHEILTLSAERGWSDNYLCEVSGTLPNTLGNWVNGKRDPRMSGLEDLAVALGMRIALVPDARAAEMSERAQAAARRKQARAA